MDFPMLCCTPAFCSVPCESVMLSPHKLVAQQSLALSTLTEHRLQAWPEVIFLLVFFLL